MNCYCHGWNEFLVCEAEYSPGLIILTWRTYCVSYAEASYVFHQAVDVLRSTEIRLRSTMFLMYTADLSDTEAKHGVTLYAFADDNQLYVHSEFHKWQHRGMCWNAAYRTLVIKFRQTV